MYCRGIRPVCKNDTSFKGERRGCGGSKCPSYVLYASKLTTMRSHLRSSGSSGWCGQLALTVGFDMRFEIQKQRVSGRER